ncbi:odorant-binding protein 2b-like [Fukomys damarensis]|uniref:odorant-binding protein 2b-like n=1 Tax=Fukomys damarensis TaxID=885580 RepID=UPI00053FC09F|nr:odorant-binding protein 2b-like [Fukomys damarensis]
MDVDLACRDRREGCGQHPVQAGPGGRGHKGRPERSRRSLVQTPGDLLCCKHSVGDEDPAPDPRAAWPGGRSAGPGPPVPPARGAERTWYTKALVSNMTLPGPKTFQVVFPSTMTAREDGSLQARVTLMIMGQCHEKEILMQKTEEPGKYISSGGAKLIYVEELSTKDHYILYCEKRGPKKMFGVGKLIGRTPEESPEALEEFRKFVQRKGLPQEKITIPEQRESCVPERD